MATDDATDKDREHQEHGAPEASGESRKEMAHMGAAAGEAGEALKGGLASGLHAIGEIETELVSLVRHTASDALNATGEVANEALTITKDVVNGALSTTTDVGNGLVSTSTNVAKNLLAGVTDVGTDVGQLANAAASGTINIVGKLGNSAVIAVRDVLITAAGGIGEIASNILPRAAAKQTQASQTP